MNAHRRGVVFLSASREAKQGVNISARTEYACLAVMQLAASFGTDRPVRLRSIAQAHGIPAHFLVQILQQLKGAGLVASTRGAAGGYHLTQDPATITLADVMCVIEGDTTTIVRACGRDTPQSQALLSVWNQVALTQREMLAATTFQELLERAAVTTDPMYYI